MLNGWLRGTSVTRAQPTAASQGGRGLQRSWSWVPGRPPAAGAARAVGQPGFGDQGDTGHL